MLHVANIPPELTSTFDDFSEKDGTTVYSTNTYGKCKCFVSEKTREIEYPQG